MIHPEFFDTVNYALCRAIDDFLGDRAEEFFRRLGEYHLEEAAAKGLLGMRDDDAPLDALVRIARYLEASGYMEKIEIARLSDREAVVEMHGVTVTASSTKLLREGRRPSHFMTNLMFAALGKRSVRAELRDMEYDERERRFKEYWKILEAGSGS
jgi:hypothetical protein